MLSAFGLYEDKSSRKKYPNAKDKSAHHLEVEEEKKFEGDRQAVQEGREKRMEARERRQIEWAMGKPLSSADSMSNFSRAAAEVEMNTISPILDVHTLSDESDIDVWLHEASTESERTPSAVLDDDHTSTMYADAARRSGIPQAQGGSQLAFPAPQRSDVLLPRL